MEPVTIHNLKDKTAQEVVDFVKGHLLKQGCKSARVVGEGEINCLYRGPNGTKCAAGCLIPDEGYNPGMEERVWRVLIHEYDFPEEHKTLISVLQKIHDNLEVEGWEEAIDRIVLTAYEQ